MSQKNDEISDRRPDAQYLLEEYTQALLAYIGGKDGALQSAYEIGKKALSKGLTLYELAAVHHREILKKLMSVPEKRTRGITAAEILCALCPAWHASPEAGSSIAGSIQNLFNESASLYTRTCRRLRETSVALRHVNEIREQEARRIANALHDEASQLLASVHLELEQVGNDMEFPYRERILHVRSLLYDVEEQLRSLAHELRPAILEDLGLLPALECLAQGISKRFRIPITVEGSVEERLPILTETAIYRIVQEALTNVTKHAKASHIAVTLQQKEQLQCSIRDDGQGFDVSEVFCRPGQSSLGLRGIQEQLTALNGTIQIQSCRGQGTELIVTIPLEMEDTLAHGNDLNDTGRAPNWMI